MAKIIKIFKKNKKSRHPELVSGSSDLQMGMPKWFRQAHHPEHIEGLVRHDSKPRTFFSIFSIIIIISLAFFLRIYRVDSVPPSPSLDEVSIGWNAYSLLKTGRDEYGYRLPMALRAYDDYRPIPYVYLTIPFVALFGLNAIAVRLPSIILSVVSVLATYYFVQFLFDEERKTRSIQLGHIAAFFLAISPWHIYVSRLGHEVNLGLTALLVGATQLVLYTKTARLRWLVMSAMFFALSFGSYQSEKIIVPLLVFCFAVLYRSILFRNKKHVLWAITVGILLSLPTLYVTLSPNGLVRYSGSSTFSSDSYDAQENLKKYEDARTKKNLIGKIWYSPKILNGKIVIANYTKHFGIDWLTHGGATDSHKVPYTGVLYPWELFLALIGGLILLKKQTSPTVLIFSWLAIAPIPAAITNQAPHVLRAYTMLPVWQILAAIPMYSLIVHNKKLISVTSTAALVLCVLLTVPGMYTRYLTLFPKLQSQSFGYAINQAFTYLREHKKEKQNLMINPVYYDKGLSTQTYMFALFALRVDPAWYLSLGGTAGGGVGKSFTRGNLTFSTFPKYPFIPGTIYVGNITDFVPSAPVLYRAQSLDHTEGMLVVGHSL